MYLLIMIITLYGFLLLIKSKLTPYHLILSYIHDLCLIRFSKNTITLLIAQTLS